MDESRGGHSRYTVKVFKDNGNRPGITGRHCFAGRYVVWVEIVPTPSRIDGDLDLPEETASFREGNVVDKFPHKDCVLVTHSGLPQHICRVKRDPDGTIDRWRS